MGKTATTVVLVVLTLACIALAWRVRQVEARLAAVDREATNTSYALRYAIDRLP